MSALTRWERGAYGVSALLLLASMLVLPVVRAVDPVLACSISYLGDSSIAYYANLTDDYRKPSMEITLPSDPWGRPWLLLPRRAYSVGPDGLDQDGEGDDVTRDDFNDHPLHSWTPKEVLAWPRLTLLIAGLGLALWTLLTHEILRAPRARLVVEAWRAGFIAAVPAFAGLWWVALGTHNLARRFSESGAAGFLQVPASIAIPLTWALLCYLPALAWRLSRPRSEATLT